MTEIYSPFRAHVIGGVPTTSPAQASKAVPVALRDIQRDPVNGRRMDLYSVSLKSSVIGTRFARQTRVLPSTGLRYQYSRQEKRISSSSFNV